MITVGKYLIIGGGVAAAGCIEGIRKKDTKGEITVISKENHPIYCRPLISYYLQKKTDLNRINYRKDTFYEDNGCKVYYSQSAVKLDTEKKTVTLSGGGSESYEKLLIATGSYPFVPPIKGLDTVKEQFGFLTLDDALALEKALGKNRDKRVLIIGAGLIGLKCAEGIKDLAKSITVCDLSDRVLSSILDKDGGEIVENCLKENGISLMLGDTVSEFSENTAVMKSGKTTEFDILVTAVGVRADISLAKDAGIECDRGIIIGERSDTSDPFVFAAGDCAQSTDISDGTKKVLALLPSAYEEGRTAGLNMAGEETLLKNEIPMNSIGFFSLHTMTAGSKNVEDGGEIYTEKGEKSLKKLYIKDNRLIGFMLVGNVTNAGIYTNLIKEKTPLDEIDFDLVKKSPGLIAFGKEYRRKKLGGVV